MRRNIRLILAFDGTDYSGWQRQHHAPTVQGVLEEQLMVLTRHPVTLHGAGRTDAGVHALAMVANFFTESPIPIHAFMLGLNTLLPADIRILKASEMDDGFHSRFSATGKTYQYDFFTGPVLLPHRRRYTAHRPCAFDPDRVLLALALLTGTHDFSSFEGTGSRDRNQVGGRGAVRTLLQARLEQLDQTGHQHRLIFCGDGFLRHMVRNLAGTLIDVGRGKLQVEDVRHILAARDRRAAGPTAPACGLFLQKVHYQSTPCQTP